MNRGDFYFFIEDPHCDENYPLVDLYLTKDNLHISLDVPGVSRDSFDIKIDSGYIEIWGTRKEPESFSKATHFYKLESFYGNFKRRIQFPVEVEIDKATMTLEAGVLVITIPRSKPMVIEIPVE